MWNQLLSRPSVVISMVVICAIVCLAVGAHLFAPYDPTEQFFEGLTLEGAPLPPNETFWLGTDLLGRDLLSRIIYGSQTSLLIGLVANGIAIIIGTAVGVTAAYFKGWIGTVLMRFTDLMMAFPALLLAIALAAIFTPSLWIVAMVIAMVNWVQIARVVYSETLAISEKDFIAAEKAIGVSEAKILLSHVFPHLVPTMLVWGTLGISTTVLLEATLSYLGIGVQPPIPSWGNIIFENQTYFSVAPWLVFIPGSVIILLSLCFNILGDALRDALDPTLNGREAR
ncbi:ABC transporter permease [Vibrio penaeicida]|uniref:Peptide ABC transporter permease n=1 Tax=Vibrio penaeicida TaxID=104609 RepID=A0AAV5P159_9VIBR|nr:ABC transporter permease [Vibrio penaeicida]RTZ22836.1 ABC transporter permease [Vibrio penaeicida]GLQ75841.1 peptide ABC transporter permease [Vibrio penaeicida]